MASSQFNKCIQPQIKTITGTTDNDGYLRVDTLLPTGTYAIALLKGAHGEYLCAALTGVNAQFAKSSVKNTEISVTVVYI